jgi:hypothetical protein
VTSEPRVTAFRSQATRFFGELNVLLDDAQIPTNERAAFRPDFLSDTEALRAYARSPVRNCASPFPKLQSAEEFSMIQVITSLGAIETELESSCVNSL